jgi:hybrid cluster-associated redox disulfide protein
MWFPKNIPAPPAIRSSDYVDAVMRQWPQTIRVFLAHGMHCVGCPIGVFHTIDDACLEHHADVERFMQALNAAAAPAQSRDSAIR